jgi:hypothetical protein
MSFSELFFDGSSLFRKQSYAGKKIVGGDLSINKPSSLLGGMYIDHVSHTEHHLYNSKK